MTSRKQEHAETTPESDGLKLDAETVKDLEPQQPAEVRGGRSSAIGSKVASTGA